MPFMTHHEACAQGFRAQDTLQLCELFIPACVCVCAGGMYCVSIDVIVIHFISNIILLEINTHQVLSLPV